jgi:hypothetical protein
LALTVLLIAAGDQVPITPFGEVLANAGAGVPAQKAGIGTKSGEPGGCTVIVTVAGVEEAHCPSFGEKV